MIFDSVGYADQVFQLVSRQELSRTAGGQTFGKDLGPALWSAEYTTAPMTADDALSFEASLNALNGVIGEFEAYDLRRPYPRAHADGDFADEAEILSASGAKIALANLPEGFQLSPGDYLSLEVQGRRVLHQVVEAATSDSDGETGEFAVRPPPWPGTDEGAPVTLKKPSCRLAMLPQSITQKISGLYTTISFKAGQV
ncbi:hypothetical protein BN961_02915 [Afipia felis]|uniref:Uncharacterized protein n=1 Tax=Afipia felis TaxID=1035 RepID=A0A090MUM0_AFIFE|nr:hypothetical protein [Afipia felis]CEG09489.1 hypothetical protein BN961_02915 [Afipia felis]